MPKRSRQSATNQATTRPKKRKMNSWNVQKVNSLPCCWDTLSQASANLIQSNWFWINWFSSATHSQVSLRAVVSKRTSFPTGRASTKPRLNNTSPTSSHSNPGKAVPRSNTAVFHHFKLCVHRGVYLPHNLNPCTHGIYLMYGQSRVCTRKTGINESKQRTSRL